MDNIISIREIRHRRDPDAMLNLAMSNPGLIARREAKRQVYRKQLELERQEMLDMRLRAAEREILAVKALVFGVAIAFVSCLIGML